MNNEIQPPAPTRQLFGTENSAIWLAAIVGLSLSFAALLLIQKQLEAHKLLDFEWVAHNRIRALNHGLDNSMLAVTTLRDHIVASGGVDGEGFRVFAKSLLDRYRGLKALAWVPLIEGSERYQPDCSVAQGEEKIRILERDASSELVSAANRAEYFPICHAVRSKTTSSPSVLIWHRMSDWARCCPWRAVRSG